MEMKPTPDLERKKKQHQRTKLAFKIVGPILLVAGIALFVTGTVSMSSFGDYFFLSFIGIPCIFFGGTFTMLGYRRETATYVKNETTPVLNEAARDLRPSMETFADTIKGTRVCPHCGAKADPDALFCDHCGKELIRVCPKCQEKNDADATYCKNCGTKLEKEE